MPRTAPIISLANSTFFTGITVFSRSMPGWWYTQVSKKMLFSRCSSSSGFFISCASPRKRPQW